MQRYTINNRQYVVHDDQLYKVQGGTNHPIHTGTDCYDAIIYRGMIGEFECHEDTCVFVPHGDGVTELIEKKPMSETIQKLQAVHSACEKNKVVQ